MPRSRRHAPDRFAVLIAEFDAIRREFELPSSFEPDVEAAALEAAPRHEHVDRTDRRYISLDPPGSRDLDQAFSIERLGAVLRLRYAIADVATWVSPGGPVDLESARRGSTIYCPDRRVPLHPPALSEGTASLLADQSTPAVVWTVDVDPHGDATLVDLERALVRNTLAGTYEDAQRELDNDPRHGPVALMAELGSRLLAAETARGGVSLRLPDQDMVVDSTGQRAELRSRATLPVESANAQLSLTCGMLAANLMTTAKVGVLRTMPPPGNVVQESLRELGGALGHPWPDNTTYPDWLRTVPADTPEGVALLTASTRAFRGAAYSSFDGTLPDVRTHSAIAAPYAHVTAPLRRWSDRFATECCLAAVANERPPEWVTAALPSIGERMTEHAARANAVDKACADAMEAFALQPFVGSTLNAVVVGEARDGRVAVYLTDPAVTTRASATALVGVGTAVQVRVDGVDVAARSVALTVDAA